MGKQCADVSEMPNSQKMTGEYIDEEECVDEDICFAE
jgi:hypothetical protein